MVAPHLDSKEEAKRLEAEQAEDTSSLTACPGAEALLRDLRNMPWAIVTSGSRALAVARLRAVSIPVPRVLVTADDTARGKPSPQGYLRAAACLSMEPRDCVVVEDAEAGVAAAQAAGCQVIGVMGPGLGSTDALAIAVDSLSELSVEISNSLIRICRRSPA
jgi:sugar-phosphatase